QKARELLREKFLESSVAITGANFLVASSGSIAITENEGNARLSTSFPSTHIAVVGIEKLIPNLSDLYLFWPLPATHGTGQHLTVYNSILSGPRKEHETDGPEEMYVVLLDNGRTELLAQKEQREGLYCIKCGACLNVCPIYQNIGGHTYDTTYSGPIGSLITPHLKGMEEFKHLSYATSLCGKCTEVCPVKIDIQKMLLLNRRDAVQQNLQPALEKKTWKIASYFLQKRKAMDFFGGKFKNFFLKLLFKNGFGKKRSLPKMADESFSKQWVEKQKAEQKLNALGNSRVWGQCLSHDFDFDLFVVGFYVYSCGFVGAVLEFRNEPFPIFRLSHSLQASSQLRGG